MTFAKILIRLVLLMCLTVLFFSCGEIPQETSKTTATGADSQTTATTLRDSLISPTPKIVVDSGPLKPKPPKALNENEENPGVSWVDINIYNHTIEYHYVVSNKDKLENPDSLFCEMLIPVFKSARNVYPTTIADNFEKGISVERSTRPSKMKGIVFLSGPKKRKLPFQSSEYSLEEKSDSPCICTPLN
jgi:hypothetical protein